MDFTQVTIRQQRNPSPNAKKKLPPIRLRPVLVAEPTKNVNNINVDGLGLEHLVNENHPIYHASLPAHSPFPAKIKSAQEVSESRVSTSNKEMNPEPVPFAFGVFKSSTMVKKVQLVQRHPDVWGDDHALHTKGMVLHTGRYQWEESRRTPDSLPSSFSRQSDNGGSRSQQFMIDGQQIMMFERMDITDELRQLKSIVLPQRAKDLYVGRGFRLPGGHAMNKPRPPKHRTLKMPVQPPPSSDNGPEYNGKLLSPMETVPIDQLHPPSPPPRQKTREAVTIYTPPPADDPLPPAPPPSSSKSITRTAIPNPLVSISVDDFIKTEEYEKLQSAFNRLDTDHDGHLKFDQVQSQLPKGFSNAQRKFVKQIYNAVGAATFFGLKEYIGLTMIYEAISKLSDAAHASYEAVDMSSISDQVINFNLTFHKTMSEQAKELTVEDVIIITETALDNKLLPESKKQLHDTLQVEGFMGLNKAQLLAHVPYLITLPRET